MWRNPFFRFRQFCSLISNPARVSVCRCLNPNYFIHTGNFILLIAVNQTDMFALRGLSVLASGCGIAYNLLQPKPLLPAAIWGGFFLSCHAFRICLLLREQRDIDLDETEQALWESTFQTVFTKMEMRELLDVGRRVEASEGRVIAQAGAPSQYCLLLIAHGQVKVESAQGSELARSGPGDFLNEFRFVRGQCSDPEPVTSTFSSHSTAIQWDMRELQEYLESKPAVQQKLKSLFGLKMILKVERTNDSQDFKAYVNVLSGVVAHNVVMPAKLAHLDHFRDTRKISSDAHRRALQELGYTEEQYDRMIRLGRRCKCM